MTTLIIGAGYTGLALGRYLSDGAQPVVGTQTEPDTNASFPIHPYELGQEDQLTSIFENVDGDIRIVFTAGPPRSEHNEDSLDRFESFLEACPGDRIGNFLYLSSTSVYGDAGGEWVTETTPPDPVSRSGELKRDAERRVEEVLGSDVPVVHARIGGIYGPGRNPARRYLSDDYRLVGEGKKHSNRIHRDDLVRALAALSRQNESTVVNVTDRRPIALRRIIEFLYRETGRDLSELNTISWEEAEQRYSEMRLGLLKPRKKVSSQKLRTDVGFEYEYPTAFHGFRSLPPLNEPAASGPARNRVDNHPSQ